MISHIFKLYQKHTLLRFLIVGGVNTLFGYSVFSAFTLLGLHYRLAALFALIAGILFNFITYGNCVFYNNTPKLILKFILVYACIYVLNVLGLDVLTHYVSPYAAQAILVIPLAACAYKLNKNFVFCTVEKE